MTSLRLAEAYLAAATGHGSVRSLDQLRHHMEHDHGYDPLAARTFPQGTLVRRHEIEHSDPEDTWGGSGDSSSNPGFTGSRHEARQKEPTTAPADLHKIIDRTRKNGGHSVSLTSGRSPASGFMVAQKEGSHVIPASDFFSSKGHQVLRHYVTAHSGDLSKKGVHLGTWHDTDSGNVFLDIAHNIPDKTQAVKMAKEHDQIAIWDLDNKQEVPTGGTGGLDKTSAGNTCAACGMTKTPVSATMEFFKHGGNPGQ